MRVGLLLWTAGNLYVFWRAASLPLFATRARRLLLAILALLLWGSFLASRSLEGVLPAFLVRPVALVGADWLAVLFWSAAGLLIVDVVTGFGFLLKRRVPALRGAAFGVAGAFAVIGIVQAVRPPVVQEYEVRLAGLPRQADGLVVVAISDLHLGPLIGERWLAARVRQVEGLRPDVIVVLGDVLEGDTPSESGLLPRLRSLAAPLGVWAVNGNHEHYGREGGGSGRLEDAGLRVLVNRWAEVRPGLVFAGVEDLMRHGRGRTTVADPIGRALAGRPAGAATVLLSHSPLQAERAAQGGVGLMLAAHTHDGQIWPFGYFTRMNYPLMGGRYTVEGMPVIVCRGTGTWGPRMRLWRPSEILRITLRSAA
jgi:predicted MPP superfamily phosphohydrolase